MGKQTLQQESEPSVKLLLTMQEAAVALGLGLTSMYALVSRKKIPTIRLGRSRRIPLKVLQQFIETQLSEQQ